MSKIRSACIYHVEISIDYGTVISHLDQSVERLTCSCAYMDMGVDPSSGTQYDQVH